MADTKVSAFTTASTLDGTELVGGVQGGANVKVTIDQIKTYCRSRADSIYAMIRTVVLGGAFQGNSIVRTAAGVWYVFFADADNQDLFYAKSTNYGVTWGVPVTIKATTTIIGIAVWFDQWTPGDSGTAIHIAYIETGGHDVLYRRLDTSGDTLGTELTVFDGASFTAGVNTSLSVTKAKGGLVHVAFNGDNGTEVGHYVSDAATPTSFSSADGSGALNEAATTDYYHLFPANLADTADIWALFWDTSANEITVKTFDASASSWTAIAESTAIASMNDLTAATAWPNFQGAVRSSDGKLLFVAWSNADTINATLRYWDVTGNGASAPTISSPVTIVTSTDDQALCVICVDTTADDLYVFYAGKTDGSETAYTSLNIYYKISTDDGATWGAETQLSSAARAVTHLMCAKKTAGGDFAVAWGGLEFSGSHTARVSALK